MFLIKKGFVVFSVCLFACFFKQRSSSVERAQTRLRPALHPKRSASQRFAVGLPFPLALAKLIRGGGFPYYKLRIVPI